jgi:RNA polymerase sigma-70 factor (ECF subfamily)
MSDERLAEAARRGGQWAEAEIVHRYRPALMSFCRGVVGSDCADDVVNQAMLQAIIALRRGDRPRELKPWLFTIARRCAVDVMRLSSRQNSLRAQRGHPAGPSHAVEQRETVRSLVRALGHLPSHERRALVARELGGSSYEEIADELGRSVGAVRQMIYRARVVVRSGVAALVPFLPRHGGGAAPTITAGSSVVALSAGLSAATLMFGGLPSPQSPESAREPRVAMAAVASQDRALTSTSAYSPSRDHERSRNSPRPAAAQPPVASENQARAAAPIASSPPNSAQATAAAAKPTPGKPAHAHHNSAGKDHPSNGKGAGHGSEQHGAAVAKKDSPGKAPGKPAGTPGPQAPTGSTPKDPKGRPAEDPQLLTPVGAVGRSGQLSIHLVRGDLFVARVR